LNRPEIEKQIEKQSSFIETSGYACGTLREQTWGILTPSH
jgi:hypothetical protein